MLRHQVDPSSAASTDESSFSDRPPQRRGTSESKESRGLRRRGTQLDNLTIADLQKLEDLSVVARSGSAQGEEQLMKTLLERSMSLGTLDQNGSKFICHLFKLSVSI